MEEETDTWYSESEYEAACSELKFDEVVKQEIKTTKKQKKRLVVYKCTFPNCDKEFPRKNRLDRHRRKHYNEKPFICTIGDCEKSFTCRLYLNKHMKRPHGNEVPKRTKKLHRCDDCGKTFNHKFELKTHSAVHGGEKPFKCDICGDAFALRGRLKKHMKRHDGYRCQRDKCDFVGDSWSALQKHISVDHRKVYSCDFCDREFFTEHKLRLHAVIHEDKKYLCTYDGCGRSYSRQYNLRAHVKAVHSNETFKCDHAGCDSEVHYKASHIRHMKTHQQKSERTAKANFGSTKSMAAVLSEVDITREQNLRILRGEMLEQNEINEA